MSVFRVNRTKDYTTVSNHHLKNRNLSLKAKGLLTVMLSLPDDWNYSIGGLVAISLESESAIKSTLNELKENGYLQVTKLPPSVTKSGRFEYVYDVFEHPQFEKQEVEKQGVENQPLENLPLENLQVENHPVYKYTHSVNTNKLSTNKESTNNDYESFKEIYNLSCKNLCGCRMITDKRKKAIRSFLKEFTIEQWQEICTKANHSDFLIGNNDRGWKADIDFLLKTDKAAKILENGYQFSAGAKEDSSNIFYTIGKEENIF